MTDYIGFNPPLMDEYDLFPFQINLRLIRNDIIQLLKTMPGERVMEPEFGVGLQLFLFEFFDKGLESTIKNRISTAINQYDERINLQEILIERPPKQPNLIYITIIGIIKDTDIDLILKLTVEDEG